MAALAFTRLILGLFRDDVLPDFQPPAVCPRGLCALLLLYHAAYLENSADMDFFFF